MSQDNNKLLAAAAFAAERHCNQKRKDIDASPYINHPLAVASLLANIGQVSDVDLLIAAILHDTVEDTETSIVEIEEEFGAPIAKLVAEVTDDKSLPKAERKQLQITSAAKKSNGAKMLKISDKICNVNDIDQHSPIGWDIKRKSKYLDWAVSVIAGCRGVNKDLDHAFDQAIEKARARLMDV